MLDLLAPWMVEGAGGPGLVADLVKKDDVNLGVCWKVNDHGFW